MEIEMRLIPDSVRFADFENCTPVVAVVTESTSAHAAPDQGLSLAWVIGGAAILCITLCIVYQVNRSSEEEC